jgi:ubiquinone biosynthesis protein UbiJ
MQNSIPSPLLAFAEIASNRLLALDEDVIKRCSTLQGKCIAIEITDLEITLYCHPGSWGIRLSQHAPKDIDATISGRLFSLFDLALEDDKISASIRERVSINGDASVAQQMQKILSEIDIDWEEVLSQYTGDVLAFQVHQKARQAKNYLHQGINALMQTNSEYLREEARLTPTLPEFERFQQQVTTIKHDVDRVEAKLRQLAKSIQEKNQA